MACEVNNRRSHETLNFARLDWWYFPDDRLLGLQGKTACALGLKISDNVISLADEVIE